MEHVIIRKVFVSDKSKDGREFKSKKGDKFWKVGVKVESPDVPSDVWLTKLAFNQKDPALTLKENEEVALKVWQDDNGYWNFDFPKPEEEMKDQLRMLELTVAALRDRVEDLENGAGANLGAAMREMKKGETDTPF